MRLTSRILRNGNEAAGMKRAGGQRGNKEEMTEVQRGESGIEDYGALRRE